MIVCATILLNKVNIFTRTLLNLKCLVSFGDRVNFLFTGNKDIVLMIFVFLFSVNAWYRQLVWQKIGKTQFGTMFSDWIIYLFFFVSSYSHIKTYWVKLAWPIFLDWLSTSSIYDLYMILYLSNQQRDYFFLNGKQWDYFMRSFLLQDNVLIICVAFL